MGEHGGEPGPVPGAPVLVLERHLVLGGIYAPRCTRAHVCALAGGCAVCMCVCVCVCERTGTQIGGAPLSGGLLG